MLLSKNILHLLWKEWEECSDEMKKYLCKRIVLQNAHFENAFKALHDAIHDESPVNLYSKSEHSRQWYEQKPKKHRHTSRYSTTSCTEAQKALDNELTRLLNTPP